MCQLVMCNFGVFCKYQIKFIVQSPGTRSTGTPQLTSQAEKDAEQSPAVLLLGSAPAPGWAQLPCRTNPEQRHKRAGSINSTTNCPLWMAALRWLRLLAVGSSLSQVLSREEGSVPGLARDRSGLCWAKSGTGAPVTAPCWARSATCPGC